MSTGLSEPYGGDNWSNRNREYVKITKDYALAAANAFQKIPQDESKPFSFVYVSGAGTTHEPGPFSAIFARVKGETELALAEMRKQNPLFHTSTVRPAFVDAAAHEAVKAYIPTPTFAMVAGAAVLGPVVRMAVKGSWSPTEPLGRFLTGMAMGKYERAMDGPGVERLGAFPVVGNVAFRRAMGLDK